MGGLGKEANSHKLQQQEIVAKGAFLSKVYPPINALEHVVMLSKKHTGSLAGKTLMGVWPVTETTRSTEEAIVCKRRD